MRRNFFALLSLLVVCAVGAASLPATAAERYPVSYNFGIAADPVAAAYVLNALDPARPRTVPCMLVLPYVGPPPGSR